MTIAVKYCGGCNETYDRADAVNRIKDELPHHTFVYFEPGKSYDAIIAVNGCMSTCVTLDAAADKVFVIRSIEDAEQAIKSLKTQ